MSLTNEQAYDRALGVLLSVAGLACTKEILSEVIVEFRKHTPSNADVTDCAGQAFAFGPDLLTRARAVAQSETPERVEPR
ncbi:hypothetical protein DF118_06300 [Burkholderia stagnalis]|nr:hypothetical protein DF163_17865 [Burkholderia stagnalis]RQQ32936.1 hypothetical protein DF149_13310 [Burkholderia stagnalis]RQQ48883.1 hypothetical protein DF162_15105 [Burkholderia stagnalis]RQX85997.1 hypothetical protein DF119_34600 [Burkholderia stagnalis]RQY16694.1 hypothetical protein DF118_06300 [Burkholderia stagnalis]